MLRSSLVLLALLGSASVPVHSRPLLTAGPPAHVGEWAKAGADYIRMEFDENQLKDITIHDAVASVHSVPLRNLSTTPTKISFEVTYPALNNGWGAWGTSQFSLDIPTAVLTESKSGAVGPTAQWRRVVPPKPLEPLVRPTTWDNQTFNVMTANLQGWHSHGNGFGVFKEWHDNKGLDIAGFQVGWRTTRAGYFRHFRQRGFLCETQERALLRCDYSRI